MTMHNIVEYRFIGLFVKFPRLIGHDLRLQLSDDSSLITGGIYSGVAFHLETHVQ